MADDALTDVLREKGVITKEDYIRIQAEKEKKEEQAKRETKKQLADETKKQIETNLPVKVGFGHHGFSLATRDGKFETNIQWRFQFRYSFPFDSPPRTLKQFNVTEPDSSSFNVRRARIKVGGHGYKPWLKYYFEFDWPSARLLDWRVMVSKFKWATLKIGQYKIDYNRERRDSSGKQQFAERSIVNREFTIDRQIGATLYGHLFPGSMADSRYWVGVYNGTGRGENPNDDTNHMYMGRLQWNFLGRDLKFQQTDVEYHEQPAGSVAFAAVTGISKCTRFSSGGCGNLDGFLSPSKAVKGEFRIDQMMEETAFKWRGFSLQHEFHWKQIKDSQKPTGPGSKTNMMGSYSQVGYFPHYMIPLVPKPLEIAFRYAFVDPNVFMPNDMRREFTWGLNWFFAGHRNKLTADVRREVLAQAGADRSEWGGRLQYDVSF